MIARALRKEDIEQLKGIHEKYFKNEFLFPDFLNSNFLSSFVVTDLDNKIITAGGIKAITEAVMITDKSFSVRKRKDALFDMLQIFAHINGNSKFDQLHVFAQGEDWVKHLKKFGFDEAVGKALLINT